MRAALKLAFASAVLLVPAICLAAETPAPDSQQVVSEIAKGGGFLASLFMLYQAITTRLQTIERALETVTGRLETVQSELRELHKAQAVVDAQVSSLIERKS